MGNTSDDRIDLRRFVKAIKRCKWVFISTFVVLMAGSIFFALTREPKYEVYSIMLVESEQGSGAGALLGGANRNSLMNMLSLGSFGSASIDNEIVVVNSYTVLERVVKKLGLNCKYFLKEGFMRKKTLYGNSPILVDAGGSLDSLEKPMQFKIELKKNGKADVKVVRGFFSTLYEKSDIDLPATVKIDDRVFTLLPTDYYVKGEPLEMNVFLSDIISTTTDLTKQVGIKPYDKKSDAVLLSYNDPNLQRGKDILNTIVSEYKEHRLKGKSEKASLGVEFIDRQLKIVHESLVQSEAEMEKFKEVNNITDISVELEVMLEAASKLNEGMLEARAQEMMCDMMLTFLKTEESKYSLLPVAENSCGGVSNSGKGSSSSGSTSTGSNSLVSQYNALVLQRMRLLRSAKPDNVALAEVSANIDALRGAVVESVEQQKKNIKAGMSVLDNQYNEFSSRLGSTPRLERKYIMLERNRELNNQIYLFLLGKKVDFQLMQEYNAVPATVIDNAYNKENEPSGLKNLVYPAIGLVLSLLFPMLFVLYWLSRHTEIHEECDMPASANHNMVYSDVVTLRSTLLAQDSAKVLSVTYGLAGDDGMIGALRSAVTELCVQISSTGKKVLLIDFGNVCGGECRLNSMTSSQDTTIRPVAYKGVDYLGYDAGKASDILLNGKFGMLLSSLSSEYDKILLLFQYGEDTVSALVGMADNEDAAMLYMVKSGYTRRAEIDGVAKRGKGRSMIYYIY